VARPSRDWNRPYRKQERCIAVNPGLQSDPPVLYADAQPVGAGYTVPRVPSWNPASTVHSSCVDEPGSIRIDLTEALEPDVDGQPTLYFHKGGQGYLPGTVPYGHLRENALASPAPDPRFSRDEVDSQGAEPRNRRGHGAGRALEDVSGTYEVQAFKIEPDDGGLPWLYKDPGHYPGRSLSGARYDKYGDAGGGQGAGNQHFVYLMWSWMRQDGMDGNPRFEVSGGGAIRTLLRPGQIVHRCDVESITNPAWDRTGEVVGRVTAVYVQVPIAGIDLYGWMVHSHQPWVDGEWGEQRPHLTRVD
jgi:hypothetical protein